MVEPQKLQTSSAQQPPPQSTIPSVGSSGTPPRRKLNSAPDHPRSYHSSSTKPDHLKFKEEMGREIREAIIGGMPIQDFFEDFMPCHDKGGLRTFLNDIPNDYFNAIPNTAKQARSQKADNVRENSQAGGPNEDDVELGDLDGAEELDDASPGNEAASSDQPRPPHLLKEGKKTERSRRRRLFVEKDMYPIMVDLLNRGKFCPDLTFVDTSTKSDPHSRPNRKWAPDIGAYKEGAAPSNQATDFGSLETFLELKIHGTTLPFADVEEGSSETIEEKPYLPDESSTSGMLVLGQLGLLMSEICARQYRTHVLLIFLRDPEVFFLRGDRSGVIVSRSCNFRTNSKTLAEYLWRLGQLTGAERGLDPTVERASPEEAEIAKQHLDPPTRYPNQPIVKIRIPDGQNTHELLAWGWITVPDSLIGRGTRAMQVYDMGSKTVRFLKDSWRAEGLEKETDILKELNAADVTNVPTVVAGGDLCDALGASPNHRTRTQDYAGKSWSRFANDITLATFEARFQHRILEDFFGASIMDSKDAREMMLVVQGAVKAHCQAYGLKILHRDVSNNNVLLRRENGVVDGVLTDWDLAVRFELDGKGNVIPPKTPRQQYRTGTWYFMSGLLLSDPYKVHTLQDDLESFFHLVFYLSIFWFTWTGYSGSFQVLINKFFDEYSYHEDKKVFTGGTSKSAFFLDPTLLQFQDVVFTNNTPLTAWFTQMQSAFTQFYTYRRTTPIKELRIRDHSFMLDEFENVMGNTDWPDEKMFYYT